MTYKDSKGKGYKKLTDAVVPSQVRQRGKTYTVTRIDGYAFNWGTSVLKSISLPNTITTIEEFAFSGCKQRGTIVLPSSVVSVGNWSFSSSGLKSVTFNEGLTSIGECAFGFVDQQEIVLPQSLESIGDKAFRYCRNLKSVTIPVGVSRMGKRVFEDCYRLGSIVVQGSVGSIGDYTFKGCMALKHVVLEDGVSSLGEGVFDGCDSLMHVSLPGSMKRINASLFMGKQFLETVSLPYGVEEFGRSAFNGCVSLTSVELPSSLKRIGECAFSECKSLTSVVMSEGLESIGPSAFSGCERLSVVSFPRSLKAIEECAFHNCIDLKQVFIPGSVERMREKATGNVVIPPLFDDIMAFPQGCVCVVSTFASEGKTLMLPGRVILPIKYDGEIVNKDFSELISSTEAPNTVALCFAREFGFKDLEAYLTLKNSEHLVEQGRLKEAYDAAMKAYRTNPEMKGAAEYANAIDEVIKENARREELRRLEEEERRRAEEAERRAAAERARQAQAQRSQAIINGLNQISAALNNTA